MRFRHKEPISHQWLSSQSNFPTSQTAYTSHYTQQANLHASHIQISCSRVATGCLLSRRTASHCWKRYVQVTFGVQRLNSFDVILAGTLLKVSSQFVRSRLLSVKALLFCIANASRCALLQAMAASSQQSNTRSCSIELIFALHQVACAVAKENFMNNRGARCSTPFCLCGIAFSKEVIDRRLRR